MKRIGIVASLLLMVTICSSFYTKFTDPELVHSSVSYEPDKGLIVWYILSDWADREMKLTMKVRNYRRVGLPDTWAWVWSEYNVIIPVHDGNGGGRVFNVNPAWQYIGYQTPEGYTVLDHDQYYVSYYGPL